QSLDDVQLPQRTPPVQCSAVQPRDLGGELTVVAGRRQRDLADVVVEVDLPVRRQVRVIQPERHRDQAAAQRRREVEPPAQQVHQVFPGDRAAGRVRRVEDRQPCDVREVGGGLEVEELRV